MMRGIICSLSVMFAIKETMGESIESKNMITEYSLALLKKRKSEKLFMLSVPHTFLRCHKTVSIIV